MLLRNTCKLKRIYIIMAKVSVCFHQLTAFLDYILNQTTKRETFNKIVNIKIVTGLLVEGVLIL